MQLSADPIWGAFPAAESFEGFQCNILKPIYLKPEVPEDVKDSIQIVGKLLLHSYYEYSFIDVAFTHAVYAFEKALKIRWQEIHGTPPRKSLEEFIDWFSDNNYFENSYKEGLHAIRQIRNRFAHDEKKMVLGIGSFNLIYGTIDLINDLYEDQALRIYRKNGVEQLAPKLETLLKEGGITSINGERLITFKAYPVFIENKGVPEILSLSLCPIFDLTPHKNGENIRPHHRQFSLVDWLLNDEGLFALDSQTGNRFMITPISDDLNNELFLNWRTELYGIATWPLILYSVTESLADFYTNALRRLHRV